MEYFLVALSVLLSLAGIIGCILPVMPGTILNLLAVFLLQWALKPFSTIFLVMAAAAVVFVLFLDYILPVWTAKKFGATRAGIIGSLLGMLLGVLFTPVGMIGGLVLGAIIGDLYAGRSAAGSVKSGLATAFGTLLSIGIKLIVSGTLTFLVLLKVFEFYIA